MIIFLVLMLLHGQAQAIQLGQRSLLHSTLLSLKSGTISWEPPVLGFAEARDILFAARPNAKADRCIGLDTSQRIPCLIKTRYARDKKATRLALKLYERTGTIVGLLPEQGFDGGYRGKLHLVPHLPIRKDRKHLKFATEALLSIDEFSTRIEKRAGQKPRYQYRNLDFRFFRSVKRRTPAAFAGDWSVAYNVRGTLNHGVPVVRNLLFHEIFHLNDALAGDWSEHALGTIYAKIVGQCGQRVACLSKYVWGWLKVRRRTYYAFMPGNDVKEYAAELALDYLREQRAVLAGRRVKRPFKCGPPENARAWKLMADFFFAGVDFLPACKR